MNDDNEMARLHSGGATVRHNSPFASLPTPRNEKELSPEFIKKWVVPFYMEIGSHSNKNWVNSIKEIKNEITIDVCLSLLSDFNWRTRLVGSYFAAVKGYKELIEIIGVHLLKSEVCCVGHIYALTLVFFKTERCVEFLNIYLDYYLTTPQLYFDQQSIMEALLYLDTVDNTNNIQRHYDNWKLFEQNRKQVEGKKALIISDILKQKGESAAQNYLQSTLSKAEKSNELTTSYLEVQLEILNDLNQYGTNTSTANL